MAEIVQKIVPGKALVLFFSLFSLTGCATTTVTPESLKTPFASLTATQGTDQTGGMKRFNETIFIGQWEIQILNITTTADQNQITMQLTNQGQNTGEDDDIRVWFKDENNNEHADLCQGNSDEPVLVKAKETTVIERCVVGVNPSGVWVVSDAFGLGDVWSVKAE